MRFWNLERRDRVAVATFSRPPRNLMSMAAMGELETLLGEVAEDDAVTVLVITGGVPGFFVAHADLDDLAALGRGEQVEGDPGSWSRAFHHIEDMPQPVVAAGQRGRLGAAGASCVWRARCGCPPSPLTSANPRWWWASFPAPAERSDCRA